MTDCARRQKAAWAVRWLGGAIVFCIALSAVSGCNRRPREVACDLMLRSSSGPMGPTVVADPADLYVSEGTLVRVLLHNHTGSPHNFVLVQSGSIEEVLTASTVTAGDKSAEKAQAAVLARGSWVAPGQTQATAFVAPPAGHYEFTCTCGTPSHASPLRGKLVVQ